MAHLAVRLAVRLAAQPYSAERNAANRRQNLRPVAAGAAQTTSWLLEAMPGTCGAPSLAHRLSKETLSAHLARLHADAEHSLAADADRAPSGAARRRPEPTRSAPPEAGTTSERMPDAWETPDHTVVERKAPANDVEPIVPGQADNTRLEAY